MNNTPPEVIIKTQQNKIPPLIGDFYFVCCTSCLDEVKSQDDIDQILLDWDDEGDEPPYYVVYSDFEAALRAASYNGEDVQWVREKFNRPGYAREVNGQPIYL